MAFLLWKFQEKLIFPGHAFQGSAWSILKPSADRELVQLKTSTGDLIYLLFQKPSQTPDASDSARPTILFFYGGGGTLAGSIDLLSTWRALGANVAAVEYPGYGMSSGAPTETAFYAAADAAYDYLVARKDVVQSKLIVSGQSMGTGIAVDLASRKPVAALALFSPYCSIPAMARLRYPWLPTSLLLRHHFQSDRKIEQVTAPILIAHGNHDRTIPAQMSRDLAMVATKARVKTIFVEADHVDLFDAAGKELAAAMRQLIEQVNGAP